jgi:hypothetical protein
MLRAGIQRHEAEFGATLTWGGSTYPVASGAATESKQLDPGGFALGADLVVVIRSELFTAGQPRPQQTASYSPAAGATGKTYRVTDVTTPPGTSFVQIALVDPSRGA